MDYEILPGMFDILPEDKREPWRSSHLWEFVENQIRKVCREFDFEEVRSPILERSALFLRSTGETSDIASKELYRFQDKGDRDISLRPEGTASTIRLFKDQDQDWQKKHPKLFYLGPMFRYDRPQAGRYRQHHQFGAEVIGDSSPESDVELIDLLFTLYSRLGLKGLKLQLNSLGNRLSRKVYLENLVSYYQPLKDKLSLDSLRRLETNPLRVLDSKDPGDQEINRGAPSILSCLDEKSKDHFETIKSWLNKLAIPYQETPRLVRGLDYYSETVFEVVSEHLGAQSSIGGGGRYDGLLKMVGGADLPAAGFATGLERLLQTALRQESLLPPSPQRLLTVLPIGEEARKEGYTLVKRCREQGLRVSLDFSKRKISKMMEGANAACSTYVLVLGETELKDRIGKIKRMESGEEISIRLDEIPSFLFLEEHLPSLSKDYRQTSKAFQASSIRPSLEKFAYTKTPGHSILSEEDDPSFLPFINILTKKT